MTEQSAAMTGNMTDSEDEDDSVESGEDEPEDLESEFTEFKMLFWNHQFSILERMAVTWTPRLLSWLDRCFIYEQVTIMLTLSIFFYAKM